MPNMFLKYEVKGSDVSSHQGLIDYQKHVDAEPFDFVIVRIGDGIHVSRSIASQRLDNRWRANWGGFRNKVARGSYYYFRGSEDPKDQADVVIGALKTDPGEVAFFADLEYPYMQTPPPWHIMRPKFKTFVLSVDEGIKPFMREKTGMYSSVRGWTLLGNRCDFDLKGRALWPASWDSFYPTLPIEWRGLWDIWQFMVCRTDVRRKYAVSGSASLDVNVYRYSRETFRRRFRISGSILPPPPPPPPLQDPKFIKVKAWNVQIRDAPSTLTGKIIGISKQQAIWPVEELVKDFQNREWAKVQEKVYIAGWLGEYIY